jgi:hypothetical protein
MIEVRKVVAFLSLFLVPTSIGVVRSTGAGVWDPCNSIYNLPEGVLFACPQGDGDPLGPQGLTIEVFVRDNTNVPIKGIPAEDFWLVGCNDLLELCGGSASIDASGPTDANGYTTIVGDLAGGGCDSGGVRIVVQGTVLGAGVCGTPCIPIKVRSPDINGNLLVNLADFALFGAGYTSPPKPYDECLDFATSFGIVNLGDFAKFGSHYNHVC